MDDRLPGYGDGYRAFGPNDQLAPTEPRVRRSDGYSSARDYAVADRGGRGDDGYYRPRDPYGDRYETRSDRYDSRERDAYGQRGDYRGERYREPDRGRDDRGFFDRAGDEIRSWFGDEGAERRRERDYREQASRDDHHYGAWRRERIAELDRDYDEYRRENSERFHREFSSWRSDRQSQRDGLSRVNEHMEVIGSDGAHIGTVDKVRGDRIVLTRSDSDAGGHHHSIPSRWIESVDDKVTLRKTADEAKAHWKDEERGAMFGGEDRANGPHILNRSFSGTY